MISAVNNQVTHAAPVPKLDAIAATAFSAQELAIESGRGTLHGNASEQVLRIFDAIRNYGSPRVTLDRAAHFTASFKATEGQPLVLRWARALKHVAENIPVTIFDDELLVGRPNTWLGRFGLVYGELDGNLLRAAAELCARQKGQKGQKGAVVVTDADQRVMADAKVGGHG